MKKIKLDRDFFLIISAMIVLFTLSCGPSKEEIEARQKRYNESLTNLIDGYSVTMIGDCQYLEKDAKTSSHVIFHKGDCNNPIHLYDKGIHNNNNK